MTKKTKLVERFLELPNDFHYNELVLMLKHFGYEEVRKGKTSGSRVKFIKENGVSIYLHKPHPTGILKHYQLKQIKEILDL